MCVQLAGRPYIGVPATRAPCRSAVQNGHGVAVETGEPAGALATGGLGEPMVVGRVPRGSVFDSGVTRLGLRARGRRGGPRTVADACHRSSVGGAVEKAAALGLGLWLRKRHKCVRVMVLCVCVCMYAQVA